MGAAMGDTLTERSRQILEAIIEDYIKTAPQNPKTPKPLSCVILVCILIFKTLNQIYE